MTNFLDKLENQAILKKKRKQSFLPTQINGLKQALNLPGLHQGTIIEIKGTPDLSSFYFALQCLKDSQLKGNYGWLVDCECLAEPTILSNFGINITNLLYSQPNDSEETFSLICNVLKYNGLNLIVINSALSLFPLTHNYQWFRDKMFQLKQALRGTKTSIIIINPYPHCKYDILGEFSSIVIHIKRRKSIKIKEKFAGFNIEGEILKNSINFCLGKFTHKILTNNN